RPDDHADARREGQPGAVGEGLEALQVDRLQIHGGRKGASYGKPRVSFGRQWLKPVPTRLRLRRTLPSNAQFRQRLLGGRLLGLLLAAAGSAADLIAAHARANLEAPVVRRPLLARHLIADHVAVTRKTLLELGLEVEPLPRRLFDLLSEGLDDRSRGGLEAVC